MCTTEDDLYQFGRKKYRKRGKHREGRKKGGGRKEEGRREGREGEREGGMKDGRGLAVHRRRAGRRQWENS